MAAFTVRVELHGANELHYQILHERAEYDFPAYAGTSQQLGEYVARIADPIRPNTWVLVTEVASRFIRSESVDEPVNALLAAALGNFNAYEPRDQLPNFFGVRPRGALDGIR